MASAGKSTKARAQSSARSRPSGVPPEQKRRGRGATAPPKQQPAADKAPSPEPPPDLARALEQCRAAARRGYEIAKGNLVESAKAIDVVSKSLSQCLKSLEDGTVRTPGIVDQLKGQLAGVVHELEQLQRKKLMAKLDKLVRGK